MLLTLKRLIKVQFFHVGIFEVLKTDLKNTSRCGKRINLSGLAYNKDHLSQSIISSSEAARLKLTFKPLPNYYLVFCEYVLI